MLCDEKDMLKSVTFRRLALFVSRSEERNCILKGRLGKTCLCQMVPLVLEDVERTRFQNAAVLELYAVFRQ